jgi:hypothetical protein
MEDETDSAGRSPRHQGHVQIRVWAGALTLAFFVCAASFAATAPLGAGPAASFRHPATYLISRDGAPASIATGDLNGDGSSDLVAGDLGGTVAVLLNRGDGRFRAKRTYRAGQRAELVKLRDLNGDGKLDLASIDRETSKVSTLLNRGDGSFDSRRSYTTGRRPRSLAIGDLTGDGKPELVTANAYLSEPDHRNPGTISVFVNKGDGTFRTKVDYHTGKFPTSVALSDLNADGKLDVATANVDANTASVFMNRGNGVLERRRESRAGSAPGALAIGDLNGDGNPDLVTLSPRTEKVSVLINAGRGSFRPPRSYRAVPSDTLPPHIGPPRTLAIGDLDGDGRPDLATVSECSSAIAVLNNRGDGTFEENIDYRTGCATSIAMGELNGDDKTDLATVNSSAPSPRLDSVYVFINKPGRCTVQPVVSRGLAAAKSALVRANCRVGTIRLRNSRRGVKGQVIDQSPSFGALLPRGGKVSLVVSRGRQR